MSESLFPCELSKETVSLTKDAVDMAVKTWGQRTLTELEAEERLSYSCEKVGFACKLISFHVLVNNVLRKYKVREVQGPKENQEMDAMQDKIRDFPILSYTESW